MACRSGLVEKLIKTNFATGLQADKNGNQRGGPGGEDSCQEEGRGWGSQRGFHLFKRRCINRGQLSFKTREMRGSWGAPTRLLTEKKSNTFPGAKNKGRIIFKHWVGSNAKASVIKQKSI